MMSSKLLCALLIWFVAACAALPHPADPGSPNTRSSLRDIHQQLRPENGVDRGVWGDISVCPADTFVRSFEFKYEDIGHLDETAGNAVKLYCTNSVSGTNTYVTSTEGVSGEWRGIRSCSGKNSVLVGARMEALVDQGTLHDDMGATNVQMMCSEDYQVLDGIHGPAKASKEEEEGTNPRGAEQTITRELVTLPDGRTVQKIRTNTLPKEDEDPTFGIWLHCNDGYTICGLQTRVEPVHAVNDDAGLTDIIFFCC